MSSKGPPYSGYKFIINLEYVTGRNGLKRLGFLACVSSLKKHFFREIIVEMGCNLYGRNILLLSAAFQKSVANLKAASVRACPHLNFGWMKLQIHS